MELRESLSADLGVTERRSAGEIKERARGFIVRRPVSRGVCQQEKVHL